MDPLSFINLKQHLLDCGHKNQTISSDASSKVGETLSFIQSNKSVAHVSILLTSAIQSLERNNQFNTKIKALDIIQTVISTFNDAYPSFLYKQVPQLINGVYDSLTDVKRVVSDKAKVVMTQICELINNRDIKDVIPAVIECIIKPAETQECIHKLASTTFVQTVEAPALSLLVPLLLRGLRERVTAVKRKSALIIENMSKLVDDPTEAKVFLPRLLPELEKASNEVADPECRKVVVRAMDLLKRLEADCGTIDNTHSANIEYQNVIAQHTKVESEDLEAYYAALADCLVNAEERTVEWWFVAFGDVITNTPELIQSCFALKAASTNKNCQQQDVVEEEGEPICDCEFSLAYGAKILLNNARLALKRSKRYGLCGPNGVGKSTLLRAIDNGQVDGFPSKQEVCTVYVEHDIDGSEAETNVIEFIMNNQQLQDIYTTRGQQDQLTTEFVQHTLNDFGFTHEMQTSAIRSLSGGWKMKLALARAVLMKADILLLDEPTNHLDVNNVAWLVNYLNNANNVSCIIVSHDSGFLDNVCTNIIHYDNRKLKIYIGNLSKFVEQVPSAQSYYALDATQYKFQFPEPGFLEGVKTKDKAILKMDKASFKYPNTERWIIENASLYVALNSRIGCIGPNGAGKSTLIKMLTGETEPTSGTVWKHPNLRIAYVAQHAFHHIESHLDKTPVEYIQWRFAPGDDREAHTKATRQISEEEAKAMATAKTLAPDGVQRKVEKIIARRKLKKDYEYEVQWVGLAIDNTSWLTRNTLEDMGFTKMVNEIDMKEAAAAGLYARPLTTINVEKHLEDLGLDSEFATHNRMRGLSGGQKVKVVLGAATWLQPHIIVLDEPTNYLDRDSLGALSGAIKDFGGGIVVISHNDEFIKSVAVETWTVGGGKVEVYNPFATAIKAKEKVDFKVQEEYTDSMGNTIKIKAPKKTNMSNKEKKALAKLRKARRERGEVVTDSEDEY
jgi:elongation factor 3